MTKTTYLGLLLPLLAACSPPPYQDDANAEGHTAPTALTAKANKAVLEQRSFQNRTDFEDANRGLIARDDNLRIEAEKASLIWSMHDYDFIDPQGQNAPASVNPSLWRQAALNNIHGLFKVADSIYQLRGYDLSNMSIIQGDSGWILVDPLTAKETAARALAFARQHLGTQPIKAILYTHSHLDHFGGVQGILEQLSAEERAALQIIAPEGFAEEATSENIIAGIAMGRRAMYMYGKRLARDERGHIDSGLGKSPAFGTHSFVSPTRLIQTTGEELSIDGVPFVFQMVSGSEAPAEFTFYLPTLKAFCGAEMLSHNLHNLYTLRGAKVRDALVWSHYIDEALHLFGDADVYFGSHHWPVWDQDNIKDFLATQRDTYQFIHDQSVRMLNQGLTPNEIAEALRLPEALNQGFHNQGYYGTVSHNAKAVYQSYLGWYTGNPSKLNPLPETDAAARYIDMMGGVEQVLTRAQQQFDEASTMEVEDGTRTYRWLAELLNHAVMADPDNHQATQLLAKVYDQLGYQAESAPWRDVYLSGAYELRHGTPEQGIGPAKMKEVLQETPITYLLDSMAVRLLADKAADKQLTIKLVIPDLKESHLITVANSVMHHRTTDAGSSADATLTISHPLFIDVIVGEAQLQDLLFGDQLQLEGSKLSLVEFFTLLDKPEGTFNIVTP